MMEKASTAFREGAPVSAAQAASVILDGVREERWRILVGADAHALDTAVRAEPELAYEGAGFQEVMRQANQRDSAADHTDFGRYQKRTRDSPQQTRPSLFCPE